MRSNLLSLQQTAKLQDLTQNRLATGLKVNSAIDNPSSYYTAQSLNNRAEDLNILLDAMSQGIQTLKAVNESIEAGTKFLEQAKSVASSALETAQPVIAKVSTEAELLAAVNSGKKGLIVLTSDITMSTNQDIVLNDGQSLVGARYIDKSAAQTKLTFKNDTWRPMNAIEAGNNSLISDITLVYDTNYNGYPSGDLKQNTGVVQIENKNGVVINNTNILLSTSSTANWGGTWVAGVLAESSDVNISGTNNFNSTGIRAIGFASNHGSTINISGKIKTYSKDASAYNSTWNSTINFMPDTVVLNKSKYSAFDTGVYSSINFLAGIKVYNEILTTEADEQYIFSASGGTGTFRVAQGVEINFKSPKGINKSWTSNKPWEMEIVPHASGIEDLGNFAESFSEKTPGNFPAEFADLDNLSDYIKNSHPENLDSGNYANQFNQILTQYDMLINDSWYKGVNLLKSQDLKVVFNESRTSDLDIKGVDATTKGLGLETADWSSADGVQDSLDQIDSAITQLRLYASEFGNYYQIVTTRENFTNSLINVLTEGADALTLADMNQESANMLALQTRQQLAVNSLSLASQASQSVLKLF